MNSMTARRSGPRSTIDVPCEPSLTEAPLGEPCASDLAAVFRALGDPIRLRLCSIVTSAAPDEVCACNLSIPVDRSPATVSHHMGVLRRAGLITSEKRGTLVFYRVVPSRFQELRELLDLPE